MGRAWWKHSGIEKQKKLSQLPQNRDVTGRFLAGQSGNPSGRPKGFRAYIKESTAEGNELVDVVLAVLRDQNASNRERMEAATWLADRGFGKPAPVRDDDAPGIGDFTIVIGDHDVRGNPLIES